MKMGVEGTGQTMRGVEGARQTMRGVEGAGQRALRNARTGLSIGWAERGDQVEGRAEKGYLTVRKKSPLVSLRGRDGHTV